ncbi:hypothetical protein FSP39_019868 [Pinctada imbricata]|uniref:TASOR pseudo-PARP domain-containing protein n=1 Tax=Pinctada imbricata TaxID=66713 RepID=A0AA89BRI9_PINIB|nr:hypothetical protein FSP39_019868 [Pinctada imbricata]
MDVRNLVSDIAATCRTGDDLEYLWNMKTIWLVQNPELDNNYERRRQMMRRTGRTFEETKDTLLFVAEGWANVQRICKYGMRSRVKLRNVLGDTDFGVHMNRNYDILLRFMTYKNFQQATYIIVFKGILGRVNMVRARLRGDFSVLEPSPNFDCHLSNIKPSLKMDICDAMAHNYAYMYEFSRETRRPVAFPSQLTPVAVISLTRTRNKIKRNPNLIHPKQRQNVITSFRMNKHKSNNKKKVTYQAPKKAPHKRERSLRNAQRSAIREMMNHSYGRDISDDGLDRDFVVKQKSDERETESDKNSMKFKSSTKSFKEMSPSKHTKDNDKERRLSRSRSKSHSRTESEIPRKLQNQSKYESRRSRSKSIDHEPPSSSRTSYQTCENASIQEDSNSAKDTDESDNINVSAKLTHRKNLFDIFEKNNEFLSSPSDTKRMDVVGDQNCNSDAESESDVGNANDMPGKGETIVVRVFDNSDNENDCDEEDQGEFAFETAESVCEEESVDHLQDEVDPECTKLLARLKEVENEIQEEQQKLSHLENIPKVLDTILHKSTETYDSRSSTPTLDEHSFDPEHRFQVISNTSSGQVVVNKTGINETDHPWHVRIKTEPMSPPTIMSPSESCDERSTRGSEISHSDANNISTPINQGNCSLEQGSSSGSTGNYVLKAVTVDMDKTKSIYNVSSGIRIPTNQRKTEEVKDPRIQRMMKGGLKSTELDLNVFSEMIGRIKQEPLDEGYDKANSVNRDSRDTNKENSSQDKNKSRTESTEAIDSGNVACHKDVVEKTLEDLDKAIKVIQNQCSSSVNQDNSDNKQMNKHMGTGEVRGNFRPRNMGFSSYLPEYSEGGDYSRTARVLSEVFSPSKIRNEPMSSDTNYGTKNNSRPSPKIDEKIETSRRRAFNYTPERDIDKVPQRHRSRSSSPRQQEIYRSPSVGKRRLSSGKERVRRISRVSSRGRSGSRNPRRRMRSSSSSSGSRSPNRQRISMSRSPRSRYRRRRSISSSSGSRSPRRRRRSSGYSPRSPRRWRRRSSTYSSRSPRRRKRSLSHSPRKRRRSSSYSRRSPFRRRHSSSDSSRSPHKRRRSKSRSPQLNYGRNVMSYKRERPDVTARRRRSPDTLGIGQGQRILNNRTAFLDTVNNFNPGASTSLHYENNIVNKPTAYNQTQPSLSKPPFGQRCDIDYSKKGKINEPPIVSEANRTLFGWPTMEMRNISHGTATEPLSQNSDITNPRALENTDVKDIKKPGLLGDKPGDYPLKSASQEPASSEKPKEKEKEFDNTLSKAMASLLKKIMSNDEDEEKDTTTEGRMADMVIEMMKKQLQKEENTSGKVENKDKKEDQTQNPQDIPCLPNQQCMPQMPNMPNMPNMSCYPNMPPCVDPSQGMPYWPYQAFQYMQGNYMNNGMWGCPPNQPMPMCPDNQFGPNIKKEKRPDGPFGPPMPFGMNPQFQNILQHHFQNILQNIPKGRFSPTLHRNLNQGLNPPPEKRRDTHSPFPFKSTVPNSKDFDKNTRGGFMSRESRGRKSKSPIDSSSKYKKSKSYYSTGFNNSKLDHPSGSSGEQSRDKISKDDEVKK